MMNIFSTIIPIFAVILFGWMIRHKGFIPAEFVSAGNRLVFYFAIPAMVFRAISKASFHAKFNITVLIITLCSICIVFWISTAAGRLIRIKRQQMGAYIQSSYHGNLGYIGLAVSFYYLGNEGFVKASILAGFVMIFQNILSITALQIYSSVSSNRMSLTTLISKIMGNPIVASSLCGIIFSVVEIQIPLIIGRSLDILGSLALPLALLIMGASLSFGLMKVGPALIVSSGVLKLILLPGIAMAIFLFWDISAGESIPGLILLASPTATVAFVMAKEMNGDADLALAAISANTILSAITMSAWLKAGQMLLK
jgi:predicted permease